ncbi:hypothetical protein AB0H34_33645 [Saccharopolyspora shandongensis]|uniref:hypothetical protein n=1 Tax=Saccharopolyspora shandongensis TaxID=418495 RepID=UPI0033FD7832
MAWEDVLNTIAEKAVAKRDDLTSKQWIRGVDYDNVGEGVSDSWDFTKSTNAEKQTTTERRQGGEGRGNVITDTTTLSGTVRVGVMINYPEFENPEGPWLQIRGIGGNILDPLVHAPQQNQVLSIPSFGYAINALKNASAKIQSWADRFAEEAKSIETGGNFKGETAKSFQSLLQNGSHSLEQFANIVGDPLVLDSLKDSQDKYVAEVNGLLAAFISWRDHESGLWSPVNAVETAFNENVQSITHVNGTVKSINTTWGEFEVRDSWEENLRGNIEQAAKDKWKNHFSTHLDTPLPGFHNPLLHSLQTTANRIYPEPKIGPFSSTYSPSKDDPANKELDEMKKKLEEEKKNLDDSKKEQQEQQKQNEKDLQEKTSDLNDVTGKNKDTLGGGSDGAGGDTDLDGLDSADDEQTQGLGGNNSSTSDLTGTGGAGKDGLGPAGGMFGNGNGPVNSGLGSTNGSGKYDPNGSGQSSIFTPDGELMRGPDGTPLSVPNGSVINPDGTITKPDGSKVLGPDGKPLVLPKGSTIKPNTSLLDPNGTPYTGPDGKQIYAPNGSRLSPTGHLVDPMGRSIFGPGGKSIVVPDAVHNNKLGLGGGPGKKLPLSPAEIGDPTKRTTMNSSALDDKLRKPFSMPTETGGFGRGGQNGQQPMMPPPMAGGGAGGPGEKERQRTTWLSEDPDKWGLEGGFTTAIGR